MRFVQVILLIMSCALVGCGPYQFTIGKDSELYLDDDADREMRRSDLKVVAGYDNRGHKGYKVLGGSRTDDPNRRVQVVLDESVAAYVKDALQVLVGEPTGAFTPVVVWVDTLTVGESGWTASDDGDAVCSMRFGFPAEDGTIHVMRSSSEAHAVPGTGLTNAELTTRLDDALRDVLMKCTKDFLASSFDPTSRALYEEGEDLQEVTASLLEAGQSENLEGDLPVGGPVQCIGITPTYFWGGKVTSGYRVGLDLAWNARARRVATSGGFAMAAYDVENDDKGIEGRVLTIGWQFAFQYFIKPEMKGPFLGLSLGGYLAGEVIEGVDDGDDESFTGLMAEQSIGIGLTWRVLLDVGVYETWNWESDLLSTDIGFRTGVRLAF